MFIEEGIE